MELNLFNHMKKYILLSALLSMFNLSYSQQTTLLDEDFNSGFPINWLHYNSSWGGQSFAIAHNALVEASGPYFNETSKRIELPSFDLTQIASPALEFDLAMAFISHYITFSVEYSTDSIWHPLISYADTSSSIFVDYWYDDSWVPDSTDYQTLLIDLAQFTNESNIKFSFVYGYLNSWADGVWFIDNVKIFQNTSLSLSPKKESKFYRLYPNPATNSVRLDLENMTENTILKIKTLDGKTVLESQVTLNTQNFDLSHMASGIYLVSIVQNDKESVSKLIIE